MSAIEGGRRSLISPPMKRVAQQEHVVVFQLLRVLTDFLLPIRPVYQALRILAGPTVFRSIER